MARISSELAARAVGSKYDLVLIGARRARELNRGWRPTVACENGAVVTALREIEAVRVSGIHGVADHCTGPAGLDGVTVS